MKEPKTAHIWMPDGRSLCDRRSIPRASYPTSVDELRAAEAEFNQVPACGACLLLVTRMSRLAAVMLRQHTTIWPSKPSDAWASVRETRWARSLDLDEFLEREDLNDRVKFDAFLYPVDEGAVQQLLDEGEAKFAANLKALDSSSDGK